MASSAAFHFRKKHFRPEDFFSREQSEKLWGAFWRGYFMVVEKADIENEDFWVENGVSLAVSLDSCFIANDGGVGWYRYSFGRKALNIPVRGTGSMMVQRARSCLPYIVGVLAAEQNIALHCSNVEHDGMFGLLMIVLALSPPRFIVSEEDVLHIAQAVLKKWYDGAALPEETLKAYCSLHHAQVFLHASRLRLAKLTEQPTVPSCFWRVGSADFSGRFTVDEVKLNWPLVAEILMRDATSDSQLEQLTLLLTASQVGVLHGLPINMIEEFRQGAARAARVPATATPRSDGGGKGGESSGKCNQNMGHGKSSGKSDALQRPEPTPKPRPSSSPLVSLLRPRLIPNLTRGSSSTVVARAHCIAC